MFETYQRYKVYEGFTKSKIVGKGTKQTIIDHAQFPTSSLLGANKTPFHCDKTGNNSLRAKSFSQKRARIQKNSVKYNE